MNLLEFKEEIHQKLGSAITEIDLISQIDPETGQDGLDLAISAAISETGYSLPNSDPQQLLWLEKRSTRYCYQYLLNQFILNFNLSSTPEGNLDLGQVCEHLLAAIRELDAEFNEYRHLFPASKTAQTDYAVLDKYDGEAEVN